MAGKVGLLILFLTLAVSLPAAAQRTQATRPVIQQIEKLGSPADAEPPPPPVRLRATPAQLQQEASTLAQLCRQVSSQVSANAYTSKSTRTQLKNVEKLAKKLRSQLESQP